MRKSYRYTGRPNPGIGAPGPGTFGQPRKTNKNKFLTEITDSILLDKIADLKPILEPPIAKVLEKVNTWALSEKEKAINLAREKTDKEIDRISYLSQINPLVSKKEVEAMRALQKDLLTALSRTHCRVDAIRVILTS